MEFHISTTQPQAESVCGNDDRVKVDPMTSPPYNWICFLRIETHDGKRYIGSGFKINLPEIDCIAVVTAGHCTYINGHYAKSISVTFPGQGTITVFAKDLYASPEYVANKDPNYDYGLILLPGDSDGFGWSSIIPDTELANRQVTNCGYPGDKTVGTLWITGGPITNSTTYKIYYMNDTFGGESGSPVYTWYQGYWTAVGIHTQGGCPNSAVRFTPDMIKRFYLRMNALNSVTIQSVKFPQVYMRCNGDGVVAPVGSGGGQVNCQYTPPLSYEHFHIYPLAMKPSLAPPSAYPVLILSARWDNVYIRMDGSKMTQPNGGGGGIVNCQYGGRTYERYYFRKEKGKTYSFRSMVFPHCYLRLDGTGVTKHTGPGGGTVNCQYYEDPEKPLPDKVWEKFYIS